MKGFSFANRDAGLFRTLALLALPALAAAQTSVTLNMSDGSKNRFYVSDVDSITFDEEKVTELWSAAAVTPGFYYAPNWNQLADPELTEADGTYSFRLTRSTYAQWQAQFFLDTDIATSVACVYDFSVTIETGRSVSQATVKLYQSGNDDLAYFTERIDLKAGTPYTLEKKGLDGLDITKLRLVLDFGGNVSNTTVKVSGLSMAERPYLGGPNLNGYKLVWSDEFDGSTLSTSKWTHQTASSGWVNHELQNYVNHRSPGGQNVTETVDGTLRINCFKENDKIYSGRIYGRVSTGFKYCYIEARIKLPKGKGTWPAFWMMPVSGGTWPDCGEIDIMEEVGVDANRVSSSIHCKAYNHPLKTQKTHEMYCAGAEDGFHTYAMEWTADYIQTYVDGRKQLFFPNDGTGNVETWPFNKAFYPILNVAWGGDWGGYAGVDETALPVTMEVDYVRVYQK